MGFAPQENILLTQFSNYKIGGPARYFFEAHSMDEVRAALTWAKETKVNLFILGGGTNLLFADEGYDGLVLKPSLMELKHDNMTLEVGTGVLMSTLLDYCATQELSGLEWAGGLPGTVGGAVRGNAGAFKGEMKDSIIAAQSINVDSQEERVWNNKECQFGYRTSIFKTLQGKEIVLAATFNLQKGLQESIRKGMQEKIDYRTERQPLEYPNIGSTFKNVDLNQFPKTRWEEFKEVIKVDPITVVPAAHLIWQAELKGATQGGAMISPKHPNFIVNLGGATANDVLALIALAKAKVFEKFGVTLEEEVQIVSAE